MSVAGPMNPSFVAYSDETNWNGGRYRAVGVVSMPVAVSHIIGLRVRDALVACFSEAKWSKLKSHDRAQVVLSALEIVLDAAQAGDLRIDALSWDVQDSRHSVRGRCDIANLGRMHHWAFRKTMERWPPGRWFLHPDQHAQTDWSALEQTVNAVGRRAPPHNQLWRSATARTVVQLVERESADAPLVQLADLLAGLAAYSRAAYAKGCAIREKTSGQTSLFDREAIETVSTRDRARWTVIHAFAASCRARNLGVSLDSHSGLRTVNPKNPVNFWWWVPQGDYDKAPVRHEGSSDPGLLAG